MKKFSLLQSSLLYSDLLLEVDVNLLTRELLRLQSLLDCYLFKWIGTYVTEQFCEFSERPAHDILNRTLNCM